MQRYGAYKDSGVEWIGEIPEAWGVARVKNLATGDSSTFIDGDWIESDVIQDEGIRYLTTGNVGSGFYKEQGSGYISPSTFEKLRCTKVFPGDLIISRLNTPIARSCLAPDFEKEYVVAVDNVVLRGDCFDKRFMVYVMNDARYAEYALMISRGSTMKRISRTQLGNLHVVLPPLFEQQAIADYLDAKTAEIDSIVSQTERSIGLLCEYRKSVISEAVTKGLDPDAPMKDSGVEWIGEIPAGWEVEKVKYRFEITKRIAGYDGPVVLSITQNGIKAKDIESGEGQLASSYANYQWVHIGDFAMNHMDLLTGWVDCSRYEGVTSPDYRVFRATSDKLDKRFYTYLFQHCYSGKVFYGLGQGVSNYGRWRMPADEFNNFPIPIPPLSEQQAIADYLDEKTVEIDSLIDAKQRQVELLKEYRKSLISEAVTGKFKVPGLE